MSSTTIILIILAALIAAGLAFYFYFIGKKRSIPFPWLFGTLRFFTLFVVFLLLINPEFTQRQLFLEKAKLLLAVDNSSSISNYPAEGDVLDLVDFFQKNQELTERFEIGTYTFGEDLDRATAIDFSQPQTNIQKALSSLQKLYSKQATATILVSDGNQTVGNDYKYFTTQKNHSVLPILVGDTTSYEDIAITQLNANRYGFLDNRFPVEAIINYTIEQTTKKQFEIKNRDGAVVYSQLLNLDPNHNSVVVATNLPANSIGKKLYTASISPLKNEKKIINNSKKFSVEIIDERTNVLLLTDISHPDLGALKRSVEANQQQNLTIKNVVGINFEEIEYQLIILYQPNKNFKNVFERIEQENFNYFMITGLQTDWHWLNSNQSEFKKDVTEQSEYFQPVYNENYAPFQIEKNPFATYPPLEGKFGEITFSAPEQIFLFQKISSFETTQPLLATFETNGRKKAVLFGENIWKWRSRSYLNDQSFEEFDDFFGKLVQYLSKNKQKERLNVSYNAFYHENEDVLITAQYFDQNYEFDGRQRLNFSFQKNEGEKQIASFVLKGNKYELKLGNLPAGEYDFTVKVEGKEVSKTGNFEVSEFGVEQQFNNANLDGMQQFAAKQGEKLYFLSEKEDIARQLLSDPRFVPVQKSMENKIPLIEWYYLLFVLVLLLTAEWFLRKYYGLI